MANIDSGRGVAVNDEVSASKMTAESVERTHEYLSLIDAVVTGEGGDFPDPLRADQVSAAGS